MLTHPLRRLLKNIQARKRLGRRQRNRLIHIEKLEDRCLLATYSGSVGSIADNSTTEFALSVPASRRAPYCTRASDSGHQRVLYSASGARQRIATAPR